MGVTGHRDLVEAEVPALRERIHAFLMELHERFPDLQLQLITALAEGADQLAAEVALELESKLGATKETVEA